MPIVKLNSKYNGNECAMNYVLYRNCLQFIVERSVWQRLAADATSVLKSRSYSFIAAPGCMHTNWALDLLFIIYAVHMYAAFEVHCKSFQELVTFVQHFCICKTVQSQTHFIHMFWPQKQNSNCKVGWKHNFVLAKYIEDEKKCIHLSSCTANSSLCSTLSMVYKRCV